MNELIMTKVETKKFCNSFAKLVYQCLWDVGDITSFICLTMTFGEFVLCSQFVRS